MGGEVAQCWGHFFAPWVLLWWLIGFVPTCMVLRWSHLLAMRETRIPTLAGRVSTSSTHISQQVRESNTISWRRVLSALNPDRLYFDKTKLEFLLLLLVLSQVKTLTTIVLSGTHHGDVTAFFLYYSQDGQRWTVWRTKPPAPVSDIVCKLIHWPQFLRRLSSYWWLIAS